jgi:serine/threonine-protein kinase RsbW
MAETLADMVELRVPPDPKYIAVVRLTVAGVASRTGLTVEDVDDLKVAVCEVFTNTIDHAYEGMAARPVVIRMTPGPADLRVEVVDEGVGFDAGKRSFTGEADLSGEGGLGLYLVHRYMDEVRIESAPGSGTRVIMTKRLPR